MGGEVGMIGDKGMFGGVCVDIIHTEEYGDIEIYSFELEKEMEQSECPARKEKKYSKEVKWE